MTGPRGTGIGSMPGVDFAESLRIVAELTPDLVALPELPARGPHAATVGRALAIAAEMPVDFDAHGWRLSATPGSAARRARRLLAQDLDHAEEVLDGFAPHLKVQVAGPWTVAAATELRSGEKVLGDRGARRDLAGALAAGIADHLAEVRRRLAPAELVLQIDEPSLPAVAAGSIPTASGLHRYWSIDDHELSEALSDLVAAAVGSSVTVHCCAPDLPVRLLAGTGIDAISFDASLATASEDWAQAFERGVDLWPGTLDRVDQFFGALGFAMDEVGERLVVTPPCGLAGSTPAEARRALETVQRLARG